MSAYLIGVLVIAAGVVLPKVVPALTMPNDPPAAAQRWLSCLVPAILGALTVPMVMRTATSVTGFAQSLPTIAVYIAIGIMAARVRRSIVSFGVGALVLAVLHFVGGRP